MNLLRAFQNFFLHRKASSACEGKIPSPSFSLFSTTSPLAPLLCLQCLATLICFFCLQWWRPYYFLTDDNLCAGLPFITDIGRRLLAGRSLFYSDYIFGGNYNLLRDAMYFSWDPLLILSSLLEATPARLAILDVLALFHILLCSTGFCLLLHHLRATDRIPLTNGRLLFIVLSYTFSMYALIVGSSWLNYLGPYSALPWLVYALLHPKRLVGISLIVLFQAHTLLFGHANPLIFNGVCLGILSLVLSYRDRSPAPFLRLFIGVALALLIITPLLLPSLHGFTETRRFQGMSSTSLSIFRLPPLTFILSYFISSFSVVSLAWENGFRFGELQVWAGYAMVSCAASWMLLGALFSRAKWSLLQSACLGLSLLAAVFVIRPDFITNAMTHVPILRSLRWPFRETLQFLFFIHVLIALRPNLRPWLDRGLAVIGLIFFFVPIVSFSAPSLNELTLDRRLLFSGEAARYWSKVRQHLQSDEKITLVIANQTVERESCIIPFILLGAYNYPMLLELPSASGYSQSAPASQLYLNRRSDLRTGSYDKENIPLLKQKRPDLRFVHLESLHPLKLTLIGNGAQPDIDLTPDAMESLRRVDYDSMVRKFLNQQKATKP